MFFDCIGSVTVAGEIAYFAYPDRIGVAQQDYAVADMDAVVKHACAAYAVMERAAAGCQDNGAA